jgi:hypothetical protein
MQVQSELFKQFHDNPAFKKWLSDRVFGETYLSKDPGMNAAA